MFHKYPFQFLRHSCCWFVSHFQFSFIHYLSITKCIKIIHFGSQFAHSKTHTAKVCLLFQIIPNWKMSYKQQCGCRRHDELTEGLEFKTKNSLTGPTLKQMYRILYLTIYYLKEQHICVMYVQNLVNQNMAIKLKN